MRIVRRAIHACIFFFYLEYAGIRVYGTNAYRSERYYYLHISRKKAKEGD